MAQGTPRDVGRIPSESLRHIRIARMDSKVEIHRGRTQGSGASEPEDLLAGRERDKIDKREIR